MTRAEEIRQWIRAHHPNVPIDRYPDHIVGKLDSLLAGPLPPHAAAIFAGVTLPPISRAAAFKAWLIGRPFRGPARKKPPLLRFARWRRPFKGAEP